MGTPVTSGKENQKLHEQTLEEINREKRNLKIQKLNRDGKKLMKHLAFQIFLLVADADNEIDPKEISQFRTFLEQREQHCSNRFSKRVLHLTFVNYPVLIDAFQKKRIKKSFKTVERSMRFIQLCVSSKVLAEICDDLYNLAESIAQASGGFLGIKSSVSDAEQAVLEELKTIFDKTVQSSRKSKDDMTGMKALFGI